MANIVRPAKEEDAYQIAQVQVKTWQHTYKGLIPDSYLGSLDIKKRAEGWKEIIRNQKQGEYSFVAETGGKIIGWCTVGVNRDKDVSKETGELYGIYILPQYIGKGFGSQLMDHVLQVLRKDGYKRATLWVLSSNEKTRAWYEMKGWRIEGKEKIDKRDTLKLHETRYIIDL